MKRIGKANIAIVTLTTMLVGGIASSVMGTLSWYAYNTRAIVSFTGTSVRRTVQLEVGIVDDYGYYSDEEIETYNLTKDTTTDGHTIIWNHSSSGFTSEVIGAYLSSSPYAVNRLSPVTTLSTTGVDTSITLYEAPESSKECGEDHVTRAEDTKDYVRLPFAFKILNAQQQAVAGQSIWITDTVCSAERNVEKAIRVFVHANADDDLDSYTGSYLYRPGSTTSDLPGETVVAGRLDLDGDGYYDYNYQNMQQYFYGDFDNENPQLSYGEPYAESSGYVDANDTGDTGDVGTTFYARNYVGTKEPSKVGVTFNTAHYVTKNAVYPTTNAVTGEFENGRPVCTTPATTSKVGYCILTIFVEGWDHAIIDSAAGTSFNLGLQFEINRVSNE